MGTMLGFIRTNWVERWNGLVPLRTTIYSIWVSDGGIELQSVVGNHRRDPVNGTFKKVFDQAPVLQL